MSDQPKIYPQPLLQQADELLNRLVATRAVTDEKLAYTAIAIAREAAGKYLLSRGWRRERDPEDRGDVYVKGAWMRTLEQAMDLEHGT